MTKTYGFVSEEKSKAKHYITDDTRQYWQKNPYYILVYENRRNGTLKIGEANEKDYKISEREKKKYSFSVDEKENKHIALLEHFLGGLEEGSTVMFPGILTLSSNLQACIYIYKICVDKRIDIQFNQSPELDISHYTPLLSVQRDDTLALINGQITSAFNRLTKTPVNLKEIQEMSLQDKKNSTLS